MAATIEGRLRQLGYDVVGVAVSGAEAVVLARETRPDLVLMDVRLPGELDGIAAADLLRSERDVPVVYVTAYSDDETIERATLSGPLGYLVKPFDERDLHAAVEVALFRHRAERELRAAEERFRTLFERSLAGIFVAAQDGTIVECNAAFAAILGYQARPAIIGRRFSALLVDPDEWARLLASLRTVGAATNLELRLRRPDGDVLWTLANVARARDGEHESVEGQILDVTERRRAEDAVRARETLRAVLAMARATAHEIFNPLTPLMGRLALLRQRAPDPETRHQLESALRSSESIQRIVEKMTRITGIEDAPDADDPPAHS